MHCLGCLGEEDGELLPHGGQLLVVEGPEGEGDGAARLLPPPSPRLLNDRRVEGSKIALMVSGTVSRERESEERESEEREGEEREGEERKREK